MERVIVTRPIMGICWMSVCAVDDATDEEILEICNKENPSGTTAGWARVIRKETELTSLENENIRPILCSQEQGRIHFIISC
jgi:hypothetical protein